MQLQPSDINTWSLGSMCLEWFTGEVLLCIFFGNNHEVHLLSPVGMNFRNLYEDFHVRQRSPFFQVGLAPLLSFTRFLTFASIDRFVPILGCLVPDSYSYCSVAS